MRTIAPAVRRTGFIGPAHVEGVRVAGVRGSTPGRSRRAEESGGLAWGDRDLAGVLPDPEVGAVRVTSPTSSDGHPEIGRREAILPSHPEERWISIGEAP